MRVLFLGTLAAVLAGCSYPKAVHTYEYVIQYDRMTDRFEPLVSLVYMPDGAKMSSYQDFIIGSIAIGTMRVDDAQAAEHYATLFRTLLQRHVRETKCFSLVTLDSGFDAGEPTLRLDAKITRFNLGSGISRFLSWSFFFLQSVAATDFQVEGRITDARTGELVMEFVDRRRHLGNTPWGPNPHTFSSEFVMKRTMYETATSIGKLVGMASNGLPEEAREE